MCLESFAGCGVDVDRPIKSLTYRQWAGWWVDDRRKRWRRELNFIVSFAWSGCVPANIFMKSENTKIYSKTCFEFVSYWPHGKPCDRATTMKWTLERCSDMRWASLIAKSLATLPTNSIIMSRWQIALQAAECGRSWLKLFRQISK